MGERAITTALVAAAAVNLVQESPWSVDGVLVVAALAGVIARVGQLMVNDERLGLRALVGHLLLTSMICYAVVATGQWVWPKAPPSILQVLGIFFGVAGNEAAMRFIAKRFGLEVAPVRGTRVPTEPPAGQVRSGEKAAGEVRGDDGA